MAFNKILKAFVNKEFLTTQKKFFPSLPHLCKDEIIKIWNGITGLKLPQNVFFTILSTFLSARLYFSLNITFLPPSVLLDTISHSSLNFLGLVTATKGDTALLKEQVGVFQKQTLLHPTKGRLEGLTKMLSWAGEPWREWEADPLLGCPVAPTSQAAFSPRCFQPSSWLCQPTHTWA